MLEQWALVVGFLGVAFAVIIQYETLTQSQKPRYRKWLQAIIVLIGLSVLMQIVGIAF